MATHSISKYFTKKDTRIVFTGEELDIFIPKTNFDSDLATQLTDRVNAFGLLTVQCKNGKTVETATMNLPTFVNFYPKHTDEKTDDEGNKFFIMKFFKNEEVMDKGTTAQQSNATMYLQMICHGKVPNTIPYGKLLDVWERNLLSNNADFQVAMTVKEIIIAQMNRTKGKPEEKYAMVLGKNPKADPYGYEPTTINKVCSMSSTFSAITFENMDEMIITSLNRKQQGKTETDTPLEQIVKM